MIDFVFIFKRIFSLGIEFWVSSFLFLSFKKKCHSIIFWPPLFLVKIQQLLYFLFSWQYLLSLAAFKLFFPITFVFSSLNIMCLEWLFSYLLSLGLTKFLDLQHNIFHQIWKIFSPYFLYIFFFPSRSLFLSFSNLSSFSFVIITHILDYLIMSHA